MLELAVSAATWPSSNLRTTEDDWPVVMVSPWFTWSPTRSSRPGAVPVLAWTEPAAAVTTALANARSANANANSASKTTDIFFIVLPPGFGTSRSPWHPVFEPGCSGDDMRCRAYHGAPKFAASPAGYV